MSYRLLHYSLLVLLLGLDVCAISISGIGAFWLRCRTGLFENVDHQVIDLVRDDRMIWGARAKGRYRLLANAGSPGEWVLFENGALTGGEADHVRPGRGFEVDLGKPYWVEKIDLRFAGSRVPTGARMTLLPESGEPALLTAGVDSEGALALDVSRTVSGFAIFFDPEDVPTASFRVLGYDPELPWFLANPVTQVPREPYEYLLALWTVLALVGLLSKGAYRISRSLEVVDDFFLAMKAIAVAAVSVIVVLFLYRGYQEATYVGFEFSRLVVILGAVLAVVLLTANRLVIDAVHGYFLRRGLGNRKVLIVGAGPPGQQIVQRLRTHYWLAYDPVGFVDDDARLLGKSVDGVPVLGATSRLSEIARVAGTTEVIVALPSSAHKAVRDIVGRCHAENLRFRILPDLFEVISSDVQLRSLDGIPILDLEDHYLDRWDRVIKRGFDIAASLLGIALTSPLLGVLAFMIRVSSKGPAFFVQTRIGEHGRAFPMYKFRTMRVVSDTQDRADRESHFKKAVEEGAGGKVVDEARVTWVGRVIRRFSLDELPQIFNVLRGEMSLVGPRPPIPYEVESYNTWHMERLKGKPGITGLWQVSGRADLPFEEMVKLDIYYLKHWTLWVDFRILLKTFPVVIGGRGAR